MDNVKIYIKKLIRVFVFICFSANITVANTSLKKVLAFIHSCAVDIDLENVAAPDYTAKTIYVFKTDKSCIPCYKDMKEHFEDKYPEHVVVLVIIMEENYMYIQPEVTNVLQYYPGLKNFYFLFKNKEEYICELPIENAILLDWLTSPSPFFIVQSKEEIILSNSEETVQYIEDKDLYEQTMKGKYNSD